MKAVLAAFFLCLASAWAQDVPTNLEMTSAVTAVKISFAGQDGPNYKFIVHNVSDHGITAFNIRLLPQNQQRAGSKLPGAECCGENGELGTRSSPVIAAGGTFPLSYPVTSITGGIMVEAALFDDDTFQGEGPAAAHLLAQKIGFQAEHDRILPAVDKIMSDSRLDEPGKLVQIKQELEWLSVEPDPGTMQTFQQRFPNLPDCGQPCAEMMASTARSEKQLVLTKLEEFTSGNGPAATSLTQWWDATKKYITSYGCYDCGADPGSPEGRPGGKRPPTPGSDRQVGRDDLGSSPRMADTPR
jgi:hypothetical protein